MWIFKPFEVPLLSTLVFKLVGARYFLSSKLDRTTLMHLAEGYLVYKIGGWKLMIGLAVGGELLSDAVTSREFILLGDQGGDLLDFGARFIGAYLAIITDGLLI